MSSLEIGDTVGWGSDMPYCTDLYSQGEVVALHGSFVVILNEKLADSHIQPFTIRRTENVWLVDAEIRIAAARK